MTSESEHTAADLRGVAAAINSRLSSNAHISRALAFSWACGGVAIALVLIGAGVACALYGYSHTVSVKPAAEQMARAVAGALERTPIKTTVAGTMSLAPSSEVRLAPGQVVTIKEGSTVKLDANSVIRVVGNLKVETPQPSKEQLQLDAKAEGEELPFTTYTIFRSVSYGLGHVETGWYYDLSDTARPKYQECHYRQNLDKGVTTSYTIAVNDSPRRPSELAKLSFNFEGALANCVWFSGY